jgi:hypothetical protein
MRVSIQNRLILGDHLRTRGSRFPNAALKCDRPDVIHWQSLLLSFLHVLSSAVRRAFRSQPRLIRHRQKRQLLQRRRSTSPGFCSPISRIVATKSVEKPEPLRRRACVSHVQDAGRRAHEHPLYKRSVSADYIRQRQLLSRMDRSREVCVPAIQLFEWKRVESTRSRRTASHCFH